MNICRNCGVELEDNITQCPLCGNNFSDIIDETTIPVSHPSDIINLHKQESRKHLWEFTGIIAFSGITVCTIVDLVLVPGLKWSLYADASILCTWIIFSLVLRSLRKTYVLIPGIIITILAMLIMFDLISFSTDWFIPVGLPVTITAGVLISVIILLNRIFHLRGFNIIAISFLLIACFCMIIETVVDKYVTGTIEMRWSLLTAVSIFPIALILFFFITG